MSYGQMGSALSGTIAAATNGVLFALRYPEGASKLYQVERLHFQWTTLTSFTTPVTAGRALRGTIYRPDNDHVADPSGGSEFALVYKRRGDDEQLAKGYIASTGALTMTNFTQAANPRVRASLVHAGVSGAMYDEVWRYDGVEARPLYLSPGEIFAIATDSALDAGGTGQLQVDVEGREVTP
jgi:hypothetical protein